MNKKAGVEYDFLKLLNQFISQCEKGKHLQRNGKLIRSSTLQNYKYLALSLHNYSQKYALSLRIRSVNKLNKRELAAEKKYWNNFYFLYTSYLFKDCNCFDNYVGAITKMLRAFFNYLNDVKGLNIGTFHKHFYTYNEEIEIITLLPEQLNYLIYNTEFENSLSERLKRTKDIFVFGCTVALRCCDLMKLTYDNVESFNNKHYLKVVSKKTNTFTRVLLPSYAVEIIERQDKRRKSIFYHISNVNLNLNIKDLIETAGWTDTYPLTRTKRGIPTLLYKNEAKKIQYRFCDLVSAHTMRRTAITTMLCLNMPENLVRRISGHAPNSKEFYKYVQLSQSYMDGETEKLYDNLSAKKWEYA